ncbi:MAG TPA: hypothetical protein ACFYD0_14210 [Candidatus Wunengus sp. YC65]|uniref:hypothetical protein n=1 Tax=Candidatus Wunengus sp. YC65 TaxID=3367701 RepID=UPI004026C7C1
MQYFTYYLCIKSVENFEPGKVYGFKGDIPFDSSCFHRVYGRALRESVRFCMSLGVGVPLDDAFTPFVLARVRPELIKLIDRNDVRRV